MESDDILTKIMCVEAAIFRLIYRCQDAENSWRGDRSEA
jgi:hypothetical protein